MADVDVTSGGTTGHPSRRQKHTPYVVREKVTGANAASVKGSALANGDVIQALDIPADSVVLDAGYEVTTADTNGSADILGTVQVDSTAFSAANDMAATGYATPADNGRVIASAANTVDLVLGQTTSFLSNDDWEVEIYAVISDISAYPTVQTAKDSAS